MDESEIITTDANNLYWSSMKARKSSPKKALTQKFMQEQLINIEDGIDDLTHRTWVIEKMPPFLISERGHIRKIQGNTPYDRMILHSYLDFYLEPILRKYLIYDNYASQVNKGTSLARERFKKNLSRAYRLYGTNKFYVLLIDFKKFYDNIQHEKLFNAIMEKIPYTSFNEYMLWTILDSFKVDVSWMNDAEYNNRMTTVYSALDHLYEKPLGIRYMRKSLNIGNQASQLFSIFYPTKIDNYCKIVRQVKMYGRYMDDINIIHNNKNFLWSLLDGIYPISDDLGLFINKKKTNIIRVDNEFKYLNRIYYVDNKGRINERLAPNTIYREHRRLKAYIRLGKCCEQQFQSWIGTFGHLMRYYDIDKLYKLKEEANVYA